MAVTLNPEDLVTLLQEGIAGIDLTSPSKDNTDVLTVLAQSITDYLKPTLEGLDTDDSIDQELAGIRADIQTNTNNITTNTNNITTNTNNITTNTNNIQTNTNNITTNTNNITTTTGSILKLYGDNLPTVFDNTTNHVIGDRVEYLNNLYLCTSPHTGDWDADNFRKTDILTNTASIVDSETNIINNTDNNTLTAGNVVKLFGEALPELFDITTPYSVGMRVEYNNNLYRCTNPHPAGAWVGANFNRIDLVTVNTKEVYIEARSDAITIGD